MRVLLVNKFFYRRGGAEVVYFAIRDGLLARGHEVIPFSMSHPRNLETPHAPAFVPERDYEARHAPWASVALGLSMIASREARRRIGRLCDDVRPDIAHFHNIYHQLTPAVLPEVHRRGIPAVMTLHDYKIACPTYRLFRRGHPCQECVGGAFHRAVLTRCAEGSLTKSLLLALESTWHLRRRSYLRNVDRFLTPSLFLREVMIRAGLPEARLVHLPNFRPVMPEVEPFRDPDGLPYVLYAGRLSEEKGIRALLEAVRRIEGPGRLYVAGDGPLGPEVVRWVEEEGGGRVVLLGVLGAQELARYQRGARAVLVPSLWYENAPMTALEAIALGVPLVVSEIGGLPEYVGEGEGIRVPPGDVAAWARAIQSALGSGFRAARGRVAAGSSAPSLETYLDPLLEIYRGVPA